MPRFARYTSPVYSPLDCRAATVAAVGDGVLWSLSRRVFRTIVLRASSKAIQDTRKWLRRYAKARSC